MKVIDIIGREIEIYKVKLLLFMASFGVFSNVLKLNDLQRELKGFKND